MAHPVSQACPLVPSAVARSLLDKTGGDISVLHVATHACPEGLTEKRRRSPCLVAAATLPLPEAPDPGGRARGSEKSELHPGQPGPASTQGRQAEADKLNAKRGFKIHRSEPDMRTSRSS